MVSLFAFGWDNWEPDTICVGPAGQLARVGFPDFSSPRLNLIALFELCPEERCQQIGREIARANVYPGILVHLAAKKSASIGSLFPKNFGAFVKPRIIDQQRAAFSTREILGLVKA